MNSTKIPPAIAYSIQGLKFSYPHKSSAKSESCTLNIPELNIHKGCINVIRGHNGSGKTTLMKLICRLLEPEEGTISAPEQQRAVLVQQEPYLFHGTVHQNLTAPLHFLKKKGNGEELIRKNLKLIGLEDFSKRKARELSGGEKKRVAIARALMTEPEVLLLDEPDANVDSTTSRELERLILALRDEGMTIILCSHHRGFAYRTSDRIIDLFKGSPAEHDENIFKGRYTYRDELHSSFDTGKFVIDCPSRQGDYSTVVIPPENITISRGNDPMGKDNRLAAVLKSIRPYKEGRFTIDLDCGDFIMKARMSSSEISLHRYVPDDKLTVLFSPSAVRLF